MKTTYFYSIVALFILTGNMMNAQTSIFIAPEIGIHSSRNAVTGDLDVSGNFQGASVDYTGVFSYQGGIGVGIQFADRWGFMTGLKYNRKGGKLTVETRDPNNPFAVTLPDGTVTTDVGEVVQTSSFNFLSIPLLLRAQFGNQLKVGLAIGPQINMGIGEYGQNTEYNLESTNLPDEEDKFSYGESTSDLIKKNHISLVVLPYVSYELNPQSSVRLSVMFERGGDMANENFAITEIDGSRRNVDGTFRNNQFGVMISYEYRFELNLGTKY
jgi:hypothetical protein